MKITFFADIGFAGCGNEYTIDVPDDYTPFDLDDLAWDMAVEWAQSWIGDERLFSEEQWEEIGDSFEEEYVSSWWEKAEDS